MSKLTYGLGFALGTVTREFLRAVTKPRVASTAVHPQATPQGVLPPPCVPDHLCVRWIISQQWLVKAST